MMYPDYRSAQALASRYQRSRPASRKERTPRPKDSRTGGVRGHPLVTGRTRTRAQARAV